MSSKRRLAELERSLGAGTKKVLPRWALNEAKERLDHLERWHRDPDTYGTAECIEILNKYREAEGLEPLPVEPREEPPQLSTARTVEGYAADLAKRFKTEEAFREWQWREGEKAVKEMLETLGGKICRTSAALTRVSPPSWCMSHR